MLVDAEHAFDPAYSKALGVDVENLIVCQPDHGEMALESNISFLFVSSWELFLTNVCLWDRCNHSGSIQNGSSVMLKK